MKESPIKTERKTLHLPEDTIRALNKLAARNGTDFSKEVRRAIDEYLDLETTTENIDMINWVIRQELSGQLKALGNRLAGLINRLTIISAAGYYYKLLPEDVKVEVDAFVAFLKENNEYIRNLVQDYVESKTRLAMLYDTDPTHIKEQQEKAVAEADKLIANKILDVIRTMLCKDREVQSFEYTEARKAYFTEQMICEILIALEQAAMSFDMEYDDRQKAMSTELSKAARKEWYLRHKDKGVEP